MKVDCIYRTLGEYLISQFLSSKWTDAFLIGSRIFISFRYLSAYRLVKLVWSAFSLSFRLSLYSTSIKRVPLRIIKDHGDVKLRFYLRTQKEIYPLDRTNTLTVQIEIYIYYIYIYMYIRMHVYMYVCRMYICIIPL